MIEKTLGDPEMIQMIAIKLALGLGLAAALLPNEPQSSEKSAREFIEVFNRGDEDAFLKYQRQNYSKALLQRETDDQRVGSYNQLFKELQTQKITDVDVQGDTRVVLTTKSKSGEIVRFRFAFSEQLISAVAIDIGDLPPFDPDFLRPELGDNLSAADLEAALGKYFDELETKDLFSGAVLIQKDNETWFEGAYGLASRRFQVPNRLDTRFDIGSITKEFTKVAIAQLMERGQLSLKDTVGRHLPDYPSRLVAEQVTIEHLTNHTSGLGDVFTDAYFKASRLRFRTPGDYIKVFGDDPLHFNPGEGKAYSNFGYVVLGASIEAVSGQAYCDYIRINIFERADMTGSGFFASDTPVSNVAIGFTRLDDEGRPGKKIRNNILLLPVNGAPDGGSHSTVHDIAAFDRALRGNRLLSPAYTRWVFGGPAPGENRMEGSEEVAGQIAIAGGAPGLNAVLISDARSRIIILANMDEPVAEQIAEIISEELSW